jgi:hypothetical protein
MTRTWISSASTVVGFALQFVTAVRDGAPMTALFPAKELTMNPSLVSCPKCRTAEYVRNVRDIHAAAAQFTGNGGSVPYVGLLARMTGLPQPPLPPTPPTLTPPPALPALKNLVRSRRHILRYAAIVLVATLVWFAISLPLARHYFPQQLTGHAIVGLLVGDFWGFAVIIAPIYLCVALIVQRRRLSGLQSAWHAYNAAVAAAQQKLTALRAAHAEALRQAQEAVGSACYCHQCAGCFWPAEAGGGAPVRKVLAPDDFRAALAQAGGYEGLASYYRQS